MRAASVTARGEYSSDVLLVGELETAPHWWHGSAEEHGEEALAASGGRPESTGLGVVRAGYGEPPGTVVGAAEAHDEVVTVEMHGRDARGNTSPTSQASVAVVSRPPIANVRVVETVSGRVRLSFD